MMKRLLVLILVLTTTSLNSAVAKAITIQQETENNSQLQTKERTMQRQNSLRLYVNTKLTPNGLFNRYLLLSGNGVAIWTRAGNLLKLKQNITRRNIGKYQQRGNKLFIRWNDGKTWNLTAHRNGWSTGKTKKSHINTFYPPIAVKGKLNGTYIAQSTGTVGFRGGPNSHLTAYNKNTFVFYSNGRFSRSGFAGASRTAYNNTGEATRRGTGISKSSNSGTYSLKEYSLNLTYTDGKKLNHTVFKLTGWKDALMIDGRIYLKKER
ncbi:MAG: hypothetical protein AAF915_22300 [Cyanobacteria bacterium P01_D01_bin.50]